MSFRVLDVATGKPAVHWPTYEPSVYRFDTLTFSLDGRHLFASSRYGNYPNGVDIDTTTWRQKSTFESPQKGFTDVQAISMDRSLCIARQGKHRDTLFDIKARRVLVHLDAPGQGHNENIGFFSPSGARYVMYHGPTGNVTVFAIPSGKRLYQFSCAKYGIDWCFSADESRAAGFEWRAGIFHVYDMATGKHLWKSDRALPQLASATFALSPDGNLLAAWAEDWDVQIWDLRRGKRHELVLEPTLKGREKVGTGRLGDAFELCLAWSPDSRMLAVGGLLRNNSIRLWEVASGQIRHEFRGHVRPVRSLAFSPDGQVLVSTSEDTTFLVWKLFSKKR
jgi:WD40 repeat protein